VPTTNPRVAGHCTRAGGLTRGTRGFAEHSCCVPAARRGLQGAHSLWTAGRRCGPHHNSTTRLSPLDRLKFRRRPEPAKLAAEDRKGEVSLEFTGVPIAPVGATNSTDMPTGPVLDRSWPFEQPAREKWDDEHGNQGCQADPGRLVHQSSLVTVVSCHHRACRCSMRFGRDYARSAA
jgi:hypothetical protein